MPLAYDPTPTTDAHNRRRGPRVAQTRAVKIFEPSANRYIPGQTADVSPTGLRLELPASSPVRPGKLLSIHVAGPGGSALASRNAMIPARVVWAMRMPTHLQVGIEFLASAAVLLEAA